MKWDKPALLESDYQRKILEYGIRRGWWAAKVVFQSFRGGPDTVFIRRGRTIWIEVKRADEEARRQQVLRANEMLEHGAEVYEVDSLEEAKEILK